VTILQNAVNKLPEFESKPAGFPLVFYAKGYDRSVYVAERPVGILFSKELPIVVEGVSSGSISGAGVDKGWVLGQVDGVNVVRMEYEKVLQLIKKSVDKLPRQDVEATYVKLTFNMDGVDTSFNIDTAPVGIVWSEELPIVVKGFAFTSTANDMGVQPGWELKAVNDESIAGKTYEQAIEMIEAAEALVAKNLGDGGLASAGLDAFLDR